VTLAERRRRGDEHEPEDHGGKYGTDDGIATVTPQHFTVAS
jgi:hypothetical protein